MKCIDKTKCKIGEGPIWNEKEQKLYCVDGIKGEIRKLDIDRGKAEVTENIFASAIVFDKDYNMIISRSDGVFRVAESGKLSPVYDTEKYNIRYANDMKAGPDGRIYVGTQSEKRLGVSYALDGKLYSIDKDGSVKTLLCGLSLSNGLEWSADEKKFYHTDSDTHLLKEYDFDVRTGDISYTGRCITVPGIDGFTIDTDGYIYAALWGEGHIAVIETDKFEIFGYIQVPAAIPASCCFCGKNMDILAVVTADFDAPEDDESAGQTFIKKMKSSGRLPYLFGKDYLK